MNFSSGDREVVWDTRYNVVLFFNPDNYCLPHFFSICRFALLNVFSFFFVHIDKRTKLEFSIFTMKKSFFNKCVIANTFAWRYLLWSFIPWLCPAVITSSYQKVFLWEDENIISKSRLKKNSCLREKEIHGTSLIRISQNLPTSTPMRIYWIWY